MEVRFGRVQGQAAVGLLRRVHGDVCAAQQCVGIGPVLGVQRHADAATDFDFVAIHRKGTLQGVQQSLGYGACPRRVCTRQQDGKLIAAQAHEQIHLVQLRAAARSDLLQQQVARLVAKRVVDLLESVEVHEQEREWLAMLGAWCQDPLELGPQPGAIRQAGQHVVECLVVQRRLGLQPLRSARSIA